MSNSATIPNCRERLCTLVEQNLGDGGAFGLEIVGWDVAWGSWQVQLPQGLQQIPGYAIMLAAKAKGPGGAVLLGRQDFVINIDVLPGPIPTEDNVRQSLQGGYESLRTKIAAQQAAGNGQPGGGV